MHICVGVFHLCYKRVQWYVTEKVHSGVPSPSNGTTSLAWVSIATYWGQLYLPGMPAILGEGQQRSWLLAIAMATSLLQETTNLLRTVSSLISLRIFIPGLFSAERVVQNWDCRADKNYEAEEEWQTHLNIHKCLTPRFLQREATELKLKESSGSSTCTARATLPQVFAMAKAIGTNRSYHSCTHFTYWPSSTPVRM